MTDQRSSRLRLLTRLTAGTLCAMSLSCPSALAGVGLLAGVDFGLGKASTATTLASRSMNELDVRVMPSWQFGWASLGVMGQYQIVGQTTEPSAVSDTNLRGKGYLVGPGASIALGPILVQSSYEVIGKYSVANADASGNLTSYTNPKGFTLLLGWSIAPELTLDFVYGAHTYSKRVVGVTSSDIASDPFKLNHYGIGISLMIL